MANSLMSSLGKRGKSTTWVFLSFFCFALSAWPPLAWLVFLCLIPLLILLKDAARPRESFLTGYFFGVLFFSLASFWIVNVHWFLFFIAVIYQSVFFGLFTLGTWWFARARRRTPWWLILIIVPALWTNLEYLRTLGSFSLPIGFLGHQLMPYLSLMQLASVTGIYGLTFLVVLINVIFWMCLEPARWGWPAQRRRVALGCVAVVLIGLSLKGHWTIRSYRYEAAALVSVVQANIDNNKKWDLNWVEENIGRHEELSRLALTHHPRLIIWPETAVPCFLFHPERQDILSRIQNFARETQVPLLTGTQHLRAKGGKIAYNSAVLFDTNGQLNDFYAKTRLVPIMEKAPAKSLLPVLRRFGLPCIYTPGQRYTVFQLGRMRFATVICFETLYPQTVRRFVRRGAQMMVNLTNDAVALGKMKFYYRVNSDVVRVRAIENRRSFLRAANNGISSFIDPTGQVSQFAGVGTATALTGAVPLNNKLSFYTRFGDWVVLLGWGILIGGVVFVRQFRGHKT